MDYEVNRVAEKSPCGRFIRYNDVLGGGAFKIVYLGFDHVQNIQIAWNQIVFHEDLKITQENLFSEAQILESINHERVMKCFSYWFDHESKTMNMISELFPLGSLKKYLEKYYNGIVGDVAVIKNWGRQILEVLRFLHSQNPKIIHRDIKCDNIFVLGGGNQVKLGDFGLGICLKEGDFAKEVKGTPEFMAPEYYDEEYNELVDVYAFGMCLLEMVTGEYPYREECNNNCQIFRKVYTGVKPAALGKVKDSRVKDIIEKCLLPMSARPSAEELLKDPFFSYNSGSTLEACPPTPSFVPSYPFRGIHCCARDIKNLCLL